MKNKSLLIHFMLLSITSISFAKDIEGFVPEATATEALLSFSDIPGLKESFIDATPTDRAEGIVVGQLGLNGGDKQMILKLANEIADQKHGNFDSLLIVHKDQLIFESYYHRGRINLPHPQASATKVYTSMALGRAIQLGYLSMTDLDLPVVNFLQDLDAKKWVEGADNITLNHALTMRSGIRISDDQLREFDKHPTHLKGQGQVQAFLEHSAPITSESQTFLYQHDPTWVMQVIDAVVPGTAEDFIKKELLDKLGISNYVWGTDVSGLPRAGSYSSMTSRDMIKWGILTINKGQWNGEQLIPEMFIERATSKIVDQSEAYDDQVAGVTGTAYGYYWWQADLSAGGKKYLSKAARGGSGQTIAVIEELDLVVVTTTHRDVADPVSLIAQRILPAFIE